MNPELRAKAEALARRLYTVRVSSDETTDGAPIYVAYSTELEGCMGQGETAEDALADLAEAREDYIYSLLEDGLSIPEPKSRETTTTSSPVGEPLFLMKVGPEAKDLPHEVVLVALELEFA